MSENIWAPMSIPSTGSTAEKLKTLEEEVDELKTEMVFIRPKPLNYAKLTLIIFGVLTTFIGGSVVLENKISARPTEAVVEQKIERHSSVAGHPDTIKKLDDLLRQLYDNNRKLDSIQHELTAQGEDIKEIKEKLK